MSEEWKPEVCGLCHQDIRGQSITLRGSTYYHPGCIQLQSEKAAAEFDKQQFASASAGVSQPLEAGRG